MRSKYILSIFFGLITIAIIYVILPDHLLLSIMGGILAAFLCFGALILYGIHQKNQYAWIEEQIQFPVFYRGNGNFDLGAGGIRNGNIYFTEAGILCVCLDKKPGTLDDIPVQNIHHISFDDIHMHIHTKDGQLFCITLPNVPEIVQLMIEKNWMEFRQSENLA